jgi:hypothetical protein
VAGADRPQTGKPFVLSRVGVVGTRGLGGCGSVPPRRGEDTRATLHTILLLCFASALTAQPTIALVLHTQLQYICACVDNDITSNSAIEFLKGKNALKDGSPKDNVLIRRLKT